MHVTVVVPSYRRHQDLARCLAALRVQRREADAVIVTLRSDDTDAVALTAELATSWSVLRTVMVDRVGVVAAMNAALGCAEGDVLALTDDDAEPAEDWLERVVAGFEVSPEIAGMGGRDDQASAAGASAREVGRLQWFGRLIGNHHMGVGTARDVDVLKGANCAFRLAPLRAIGFDERLRGRGAQVHWELALCLALRRQRWRLVYDPAIRVKHYVGVRHDEDQLHRGRFAAAPHEDAVFNETLALAEHLSGARRAVFAAWAYAIGTATAPGLLQLPRVLVTDGREALARWSATTRARRAGFRAARKMSL